MAPKPKKMTTSEKTRKIMNRAYDLRTIEKVNATPAEKRQRARQVLDSGKTASRAKGIANREDKKKTAAKKASYSPAPMSAAAKKKAAKRAEFVSAYSKAKQIPAKKNSSVASKVGKVAGAAAKRAKTVAREGRDVVTAVGTLATGTKRNVERGDLYSDKYTPVKNLAKQIKEVGTAAVKGKKGTTSTKITPGLVIPGNKRRK